MKAIALLPLLAGVQAIAAPQITAPAVLQKRQGILGVTTVYSPSLVGFSTSWESFSFILDNTGSSTATVTTTNTNWNWCARGATSCRVATDCFFGTLYYAGTSRSSNVCTFTAPSCFTEILYQSIDDVFGYSRYACASITDGESSQIFVVQSPTSGATISTRRTSSSSRSSASSQSSSSSIRPTPTPTPTPSPAKTPIGAIVGGVVGGLAGLAILGALIFLFLLRKKRNSKPSPQPDPASYDGKDPQYFNNNHSSNHSGAAVAAGTAAAAGGIGAAGYYANENKAPHQANPPPAAFSPAPGSHEYKYDSGASYANASPSPGASPPPPAFAQVADGAGSGAQFHHPVPAPVVAAPPPSVSGVSSVGSAAPAHPQYANSAGVPVELGTDHIGRPAGVHEAP